DFVFFHGAVGGRPAGEIPVVDGTVIDDGIESFDSGLELARDKHIKALLGDSAGFEHVLDLIRALPCGAIGKEDGRCEKGSRLERRFHNSPEFHGCKRSSTTWAVK